jgi:hypothetical protein
MTAPSAPQPGDAAAAPDDAAAAPDDAVAEPLGAHQRANAAVIDDLRVLSEAWRALGMPKRAEGLDAVAERLRRDALRVLVVGEFKRGKSTLINAMLGEALLPARLAPCTALLTRLRWGPETRLWMHGEDPAIPPTAMPASALRAALSLPLEGEGPPAPWAWVDVETPLPLLAHGVELIDSPGLNEHAGRDAVALGALPEADALVVVLSCEMALSHTELRFIDEQLADRDLSRSVFFVWNRYDAVAGLPEEEAALRARSAGLLQPRIAPIDLNERVFFISSRQGLLARRAAEPEALARSGLPTFEAALAGTLVRDRGQLKRAGPALAGARSAHALLQRALPTRRAELGLPLDALEKALLQQEARRARLLAHRAAIGQRLDEAADALRLAVKVSTGQLHLHLRAQAPTVASSVQVGVFEASLRPEEVERRVAAALHAWLDQNLRGWAEATFLRQLAALRDGLREGLNQDLRAFFDDLDAARAAQQPEAGGALSLRGPDPLDELLLRVGGAGAPEAGGAAGLLGGLPMALGAALTVGALALSGPLAGAIAAGAGLLATLLTGRSAAERAQHDVSERFLAALDARMPALGQELGRAADRQADALRAALSEGLSLLMDEAEASLRAAHAALGAGQAALRAHLEALGELERAAAQAEARLSAAAR